MANREIWPGGGLSPLAGDVKTTPGSPTATVIGFQGVPIGFAFLNGGEVYQYSPIAGQWVPNALSASIMVNNIGISDDYDISVNANTNKVSINGTGLAP